MNFNINIDLEKCNGCEECVEVCTTNVFEMQNGKAVPMNEDDCIGCESCSEVCREKAVSIKKDTRLELSDTCASLLRDIL